MATYSAAREPIEKSAARSCPRRPRLGQCAVAEHLAERGSQGADVAGFDEHRVDTVGGHVAVAVDAARHDGTPVDRLDQHDAERLAVQRRRAEHRRPTQAGELLAPPIRP